ncbi:restriction endonuclease subunit S [Oenococcus sicerae]|uniref:Restriction endonuclease subunit S n=1 Tax=Oenococcus sicerae TaxID=2203724 RepID=A0ABX5QNI9_9LACO|nr:restriction endonuclease subunit S [Oenococcus sicerae]QAS70348.2 restriction endonuclease subunit S [Oenococcus sicerae]
MAEENKNIPELRFQGFSGPWEKRELGAIVSLLKDGTHGTHKDGNYAHLLSAKNIRNGQVVYDQSDRKINKPDYEIIYKNYQLKDKDLLLTIVGSIGETAIYHKNSQDLIAFQRSVAIIRGNNETKQLFLGTEFNSDAVKKQLKQLVSTSAQGGIYLGSLGKLIFQLPNLDEQAKIGSFFKTMDNLIAVNQRKLEELKKLKKAYLQKMFPQNGSEFPELRFAGYTTPWEKRKFFELYKKVTEKNDLSFGADKIISVANMYYKNDSSRSDADYMQTYNVFKIGDIAFEGNKSKNFLHGRFVENDIGDGIVSHVFDVFRPIAKYDLYFWKYYIHDENVMGDILTKVTTKATMMNNLVAKEFLKHKISVPLYKQQVKIGFFFKSLDVTISVNQRKLDALKKLKQGYLQKMFC